MHRSNNVLWDLWLRRGGSPFQKAMATWAASACFCRFSHWKSCKKKQHRVQKSHKLTPNMWILKQFPSAGADQGMLHTVSGHLRHQVLHIALQGALGLLGSDAELRRRVSLVFSDGPPLKQARDVAPKGFQEEELPKELGERGTKPPAPAPPKSPETSEKSGKKKTGRKGNLPGVNDKEYTAYGCIV